MPPAAAPPDTPPRHETVVAEAAVRAGDGDLVVGFIERFCRITKDSVAGPAGAPMRLLPWQVRLTGAVFARDPTTKQRLHRRAIVGVARKNGKTSWAAGVALYALLAEGDGAEVYSVAADREQARLVFGTAKRMTELDHHLGAAVRIYRDAIEVPATGSVYRVLSSEAYTKEGLSPTLVIADELHAFPDRDLFDVMSLAMGARREPLLLVVTTAGVLLDRFGRDTVAHELYRLGRRIATGEVVDPSLYMAWWEPADPDASPDDPLAWQQANPSLGVILDPADLASALPPTTPEAEYRTKRLDQWVTAATTWLPHGAWEACADRTRVVTKDDRVVLGFDGSWTNDSTALVGATTGDRPHLFVVAVWERPAGAASWVVPSGEVVEALLDAVSRYQVIEVACDPHYWRAQLREWDALGLPVTEWSTNVLSRMVPACRAFHTAVVERRLSHDGDPRLARHLAAATLKTDQAGARIVKTARGQRIDLAVAAVIAHDRAITGPRRSIYEEHDVLMI